MSKQQLYTDIVGFLEQVIKKNEVTGDEKESLEIAVDCIRETFKVSESAKPQNLLEIYERGVAAATSTSASAATASSTSGASSSASVSTAAVSEEDKASANELKSKGNSLMGKHDYKAAADAYTEAIAKDATNPIFYANRAAAFAHLGLHSRSADDSRKATELDPLYSKAWTRLGVALWAQGDIEGALNAYENGLKAEGDNPSEAMKRDYANVKKRYDEEKAKKQDSKDSKLDSAIDKANTEDTTTRSTEEEAPSSGGGGGFDFSQIAGMMQNPQIQQMAKSLMSDPSALGSLLNSPMAQQMKDRMASGGGMPSMNEINDIMKNMK